MIIYWFIINLLVNDASRYAAQHEVANPRNNEIYDEFLKSPALFMYVFILATSHSFAINNMEATFFSDFIFFFFLFEIETSPQPAKG